MITTDQINIGEKIYKVISIDTIKGRIKLKNDTHVIDICDKDIHKKEDRFYIREELLDQLTNIQMNHINNHDSLTI